MYISFPLDRLGSVAFASAETCKNAWDSVREKQYHGKTLQIDYGEKTRVTGDISGKSGFALPVSERCQVILGRVAEKCIRESSCIPCGS